MQRQRFSVFPHHIFCSACDTYQPGCIHWVHVTAGRAADVYLCPACVAQAYALQGAIPTLTDVVASGEVQS